jgi:hypothetical protein
MTAARRFAIVFCKSSDPAALPTCSTARKHYFDAVDREQELDKTIDSFKCDAYVYNRLAV